jgi:hypothetical protein
MQMRRTTVAYNQTLLRRRRNKTDSEPTVEPSNNEARQWQLPLARAERTRTGRDTLNGHPTAPGHPQPPRPQGRAGLSRGGVPLRTPPRPPRPPPRFSWPGRGPLTRRISPSSLAMRPPWTCKRCGHCHWQPDLPTAPSPSTRPHRLIHGTPPVTSNQASLFQLALEPSCSLTSYIATGE